MSYTETVFFSLSVFVPGITGLFKVKTADRAYLPFFFCTWLACINEVLSLFMANYQLNTAINNNIYVILEILLIIWQFKNWGLFRNIKFAFWYFLVFTIILWLIEYYPLDNIRQIRPGFRIVSSFLVVLFSINLNCRLIYTQEGRLLRSPAFIIGSGFILFFTFKIFIEVFLVYGLSASSDFYGRLFFILSCVNLFTNLIYSNAFLCIPKKIYYTDPY